MGLGLGSAPVSSATPVFKMQLQRPPRPKAHRFYSSDPVSHLPKMLMTNSGACYSPLSQLVEDSNCKASVVRQNNVYQWRNNVYQWSKMTQSMAICKRFKFKVRCSQVNVEESIVDEACELVNGTELTIGSEADSIQAYLFKAVKNNNATGILLLSDILGFQESATRDFAYRVACNGYNVLVPDVFNGDPWKKDRPMASLEEWISKQEPQRIVKDVITSAEWMINEFATVGISNKLGIIGFCFGGGRVIDVLAQDQGSYFGAGVSFYGTRIDSSAASNIKVPLLLITGDNDALCPVNVLEEISRNNKESKVVVFEGRGHGFGHRPQTPEEDADAEDAFMVMRNWLNDGLL